MRTVVIDVDSVPDLEGVLEDCRSDRLVLVGVFDREVGLRGFDGLSARFFFLSEQRDLPAFVQGFVAGLGANKIALPDEISGVARFLKGSSEIVVVTTRPQVFEGVQVETIVPTEYDSGSESSDISSESE